MALTYDEAVNLIADRAINRTFDDAAVQSLALCFKTVNIKTAVHTDEEGGKVEPYNVRGEDNGGRPKVVFEDTASTGALIPSVFIVPTVAATDMEQVEVRWMLIWKIQVPAFRAPTSPPTKNTWKLLDLEVANHPQVIITTQLSGCTFAIGTVGRKYYMGHTQPPPSSTGPVGEEHANNLRRGPVFNGLPADTKLESMFFIQPGSTNDADTLAYPPTRYANVLGFVVDTKVSFIVAIVGGGHTLAVENVFVVTQENALLWTITLV